MQKRIIENEREKSVKFIATSEIELKKNGNKEKTKKIPFEVYYRGFEIKGIQNKKSN